MFDGKYARRVIRESGWHIREQRSLSLADKLEIRFDNYCNYDQKKRKKFFFCNNDAWYAPDSENTNVSSRDTNEVSCLRGLRWYFDLVSSQSLPITLAITFTILRSLTGCRLCVQRPKTSHSFVHRFRTSAPVSRVFRSEARYGRRCKTAQEFFLYDFARLPGWIFSVVEQFFFPHVVNGGERKIDIL